MTAPAALKVALLGGIRHPRGAGIKNTLKDQELEHSRMRRQLGDTPRSLGFISQMNHKNEVFISQASPKSEDKPLFI